MRIGIISDTHDRSAAIINALAVFRAQEVTLVIHCGDWKSPETAAFFAEEAARAGLPVRGVLGNNDRDVATFLSVAASAPGDFCLFEGVYEQTLPDDKKLAAYHGHHAPTLHRLRASPEHDILLLGHTHKPKIEPTEETLIVNPGSTAFAIPRSKDWRPSIAIADTSAMEAHLVFI